MQQSTKTRQRGPGLHPDAGELARLAQLNILIARDIEQRDNLILEAREAGATWAQICEAASLSAPAAIKYAKRAGLEVAK